MWFFWAAAAWATAVATSAFNITYRDSLPDGFHRLKVTGDSVGHYYVNVLMGTPDQDFQLALDTSYGTLMLTDGVLFPWCNDVPANVTNCLYWPPYYLANLTTGYAVSYNATFDSTYTSFEVTGDLVSDTLSILSADLTLPQFTFLAVEEGLAFSLGLGGSSVGSNFLDMLNGLNITNSSLFLLFLNNRMSSSGEVHLGYVHPGYYVPPLAAVNISIDSTNQTLPIPAMAIHGINLETELGVVVSLDPEGVLPASVFFDLSGLSLYLPSSIFLELAAQLNAVYNSDYDSWMAPCSLGEVGATINFVFAGTTIRMPVSDIMLPGYGLVFSATGEPACWLSVYPCSVRGAFSLGTAMLAHAYVVVNYDSGQIAIAEAITDVYVAESTSTYTSTSPVYVNTNSTSMWTYVLTLTAYLSSMPERDGTPRMIPSNLIPNAITYNESQYSLYEEATLMSPDSTAARTVYLYSGRWYSSIPSPTGVVVATAHRTDNETQTMSAGGSTGSLPGLWSVLTTLVLLTLL